MIPSCVSSCTEPRSVRRQLPISFPQGPSRPGHQAQAYISMRPRRHVLQNTLKVVRSSNAFIFSQFRTLFRNGGLTTPFPSITSALFSSQRGGRGSASILPYVLPSYVCSKSFVCHSYENCRGVPQFFPFWNRASDQDASPERAQRAEGSLLVSPLATRHSPLPLSWFPRGLGGRACRFAHGAKGGLHPVQGSRKVFGILVQVYEEALEVERRATPLAKRRGQRRSAGTARRRNLIVQVHRVHAPPGQRLVGVLHQPSAIVAVENHARGDHHPLSRIFRRRLLTIPEMRLRHE